MRVIVVALMLTIAVIQAKPQTVPSKSSAPIQTPDRAKTATTAPAPQNAALKQASAAPKDTATTGAEASEVEKKAATKLGVELAKWGRLDVEGLSQSTLTWI